MRLGGSDFEQALGRVRENEARILELRRCIGRMEQRQQAHLLPEARRLLAAMECNQRFLSEQLRQANLSGP
jgi:hypothetical protein